MGSCAKQTFNGITQDRFDCLVKKAGAATGIAMSGNSGQASASGITVAWTFDPIAQTLDIQCTSAPFFVPCGTINSKIHELVDACP